MTPKELRLEIEKFHFDWINDIAKQTELTNGYSVKASYDEKILKLINQFKEEALISYTHWLWRQRFREMVEDIGINKIVYKYLKQE